MTDPSAPLFALLTEAPIAHDGAAGDARLADLLADASELPCAERLAALAALPAVRALLRGVLGCSAYLSGLIRRDPARLVRILDRAPSVDFPDCQRALEASLAAALGQADAMRALRVFKAELALAIALCDLGGVWSVAEVTHALSTAADAATAGAVRFLMRQAQAKGEWLAPVAGGQPKAQGNDAPVAGGQPKAPVSDCSGYIVLAMGKHGARELNYSSDIDLIVFFEPALMRLRAGVEPQAFFVRMTRDLVKLLQARTEDGYVFRTDLRLRPDPGATQVAIATPAALNYYESFGQNWERAALIKARPVAGDLAAGAAFLRDLAQFIWRKYLDFAAIADIHAMKRQIHAFRGFGDIGVAGHNIKLGRGGIREIEFFAQTQQLIAGGRQPDLRVPETIAALACLTDRGWIKPQVRDELGAAYRFLRRIEHRLQMLADEQTQTLPAEPADLERLANFAGFATTDAFAAALVPELQRVQRHYAALFETTPELTRGGFNMVFAGEADDPATVEALTRMGYERPADVIAAVRGWHHGRYAAVRSARARELLTEVQPLLIEALGETANPDLAFVGFDRLLAELPSGVQLFSLLRANPSLLQLVAAIMGTAPRLARTLGKRRNLLDAVLDPGFFGRLPSPDDLEALVAREIGGAESLELALDRARIIGSEQRFLIGVRVLTGTITASAAGASFASVAECLTRALQGRVEADLVRAHGAVPGGGAVVIAMGKLGGREMTAASDLDLIVVYDFDPNATQSDGPRPLPPVQYYARFTQRLISALSVPTAEGALYDVDMRLRPSGLKGPVATQLSSFVAYQAADAWTWEHLALTRGRVISGDGALARKVEAAICDVLRRPRERGRTGTDVRQMRELIHKEKGTTDIWDLKHVRGGLVDLEFMAQYLQLVHAAAHPQVLHQTTAEALARLAAADCLSPEHAEVLLPAARLHNDLTQVLRLCLDGVFDPAKAPDGLKALLARVADMPDFPQLEADLRRTQEEVAALFDVIVR